MLLLLNKRCSIQVPTSAKRFSQGLSTTAAVIVATTVSATVAGSVAGGVLSGGSSSVASAGSGLSSPEFALQKLFVSCELSCKLVSSTAYS